MWNTFHSQLPLILPVPVSTFSLIPSTATLGKINLHNFNVNMAMYAGMGEAFQMLLHV
jgi:hypothetical protein